MKGLRYSSYQPLYSPLEERLSCSDCNSNFYLFCQYNEPYSNQNTNEQQYQSPVQTPSAATGANSGGGGGSGSSVNSVSLLQGAIADLVSK